MRGIGERIELIEQVLFGQRNVARITPMTPHAQVGQHVQQAFLPAARAKLRKRSALDEMRLVGHRLDPAEREGVIVRPLHGFGAPSAIRVSVGTPEENEFFAAALGRVLAHA